MMTLPEAAHSKKGTEMIQTAATGHMSASHDYAAIHEEATRLARRIYEALNENVAPSETLHWGHVGDIANAREALRQINDQLFGEGEHAR